MMRIYLILLAGIGLSGCIAHPVTVEPTEPKKVSVVGYGVAGNFNEYPKPQQRLLAMRAAKLDAVRTLAEELYGTRVRSDTTLRDAAIEQDSYRAYVDAMVRGAHVVMVNHKGEGVYEALVELTFPSVLSCRYAVGSGCFASTPYVDMPPRAVYAVPAEANPTHYPQVYYFPE